MILNIDETLKIAEQIERNGVAFYETAAERFRGEEKRTTRGTECAARF